MKKRIGKLWPTYAVSVIVIYIFLLFFQLPGREVTTKDVFLNLLMINGYIGLPYVDGSHWYLTTIFSFIVVVGLFRKMEISDNWIPYMLWMVLGVGAKHFKLLLLGKILGNNFIGYVILGLMLYLLIEKRDRIDVGWLMTGIASFFYIALVSGTAYCAELLLVVPAFIAVQYKKISLLENKVLVKLGTMSYSIYLIHQNIGLSIEYRLMILNGEYLFRYAIPALGVIVVVGFFMYTAVEKNSIRR